MKLINYKEALKMTKEAIDQALVPIRAKQAKAQGEMEMMKIDEKMISLEAELQEITVKHPLDYTKLLNKMDENIPIATIPMTSKELYFQYGRLFGALGEEERMLDIVNELMLRPRLTVKDKIDYGMIASVK